MLLLLNRIAIFSCSLMWFNIIRHKLSETLSKGKFSEFCFTPYFRCMLLLRVSRMNLFNEKMKWLEVFDDKWFDWNWKNWFFFMKMSFKIKSLPSASVYSRKVSYSHQMVVIAKCFCFIYINCILSPSNLLLHRPDSILHLIAKSIMWFSKIFRKSNIFTLIKKCIIEVKSL